MGIKVNILGFNSAIPTANSHPTAQWINVNESHFLVDCGEGTQIQLRKAKAKFSKLNQIFISHLHGDHLFGLIGLISTLQLLGREKDLEIFGPKGIKDFVMNQLHHTHAHCGFYLHFHELESKESELIFENKKVEVYTLPLKHRVYCNGYLFKEKPGLRHLNISEIEKYPEIERCDYLKLKQGFDYTLENGKIIPNEDLTSATTAPKSYAFCSDTMYNENLIPLLQNVDLLYHEATFLQDMKKLADKTGHSTSLEAATIAKKANAKRLIIGHFSNRYNDYTPLLEEAKTVFPNTELPVALKEIEI